MMNPYKNIYHEAVLTSLQEMHQPLSSLVGKMVYLYMQAISEIASGLVSLIKEDALFTE